MINIEQSTGQPPITIIQPKVTIMLRLRNAALIPLWSFLLQMILFFFFFLFFFSFFFFFKPAFYLFIYFWLCWVFVSVRGQAEPLFIVVRGPFTVAASLVAEHRLQMRRLSSCGSRAQLLRGIWDTPRPGLEPACPALAGRLSTTATPGKPQMILLGRSARCFVTT